MNKNSVVLQTVVKIIIPFIQVYGIFIILNGHLSPGGGFAGGTILGSSLILYTLAYGVKKGIERFPRNNAKILESTGGIIFIIIGLLGIAKGGNFLSNNLFSSLGTFGKLFSGGIIPVVTLAIGIKVASTIVTLFYHLLEEKKI